jgi:hypothetical protein
MMGWTAEAMRAGRSVAGRGWLAAGERNRNSGPAAVLFWSRCFLACLLAAICVAAIERASAEEATPAGVVENVPSATRVRVKLDVSGELTLPAVGESAPVREPVEMAATFDFDETPAAGVGQAGAAKAAVRRRYRDAAAAMRIGESRTSATLAADARDLLVARCGTTPLPYLADGFLSGEESDLLETPFDALLLDELLPRDSDAGVALAEAWQISGDLTAGLLAIDTVESGGLEARIEQVTDGLAQGIISGIVDGAVDGVPTHVTVEGSFTVSAREAAADEGADPNQSARFLLEGRVSRAAVVILERRQASHVAPGFEVEARLAIERAPVEADRVDPDVVAETASPAGRRRGVGGPGQIWYRDSQGRLDLVHDSRWRRVEDGAHGLVLRLVDRGALVGQCSITSLPQAPATTLPTRADVQRDIERSLAGQLDRIVAAEESDRADGLRVVRVVSSGTAGRLPFRWIHYVVAARDGSQVGVTFMFEESMQQRFADADRPLVESLRLATASGQDLVPGTEREGGQANPEKATPEPAVGQTATLPGAALQ